MTIRVVRTHKCVITITDKKLAAVRRVNYAEILCSTTADLRVGIYSRLSDWIKCTENFEKYSIITLKRKKALKSYQNIRNLKQKYLV